MVDGFKSFYLSFLVDGEENVRKSAIEVLSNLIKVRFLLFGERKGGRERGRKEEGRKEEDRREGGKEEEKYIFIASNYF